jgi:crotonobetainyl-CoA:carnitine CoA-transferase CaiB-like acyl-CoA transferase
VVRRVLALASVLDGRLAGNEKRLLADAGADVARVTALRDAFVRGKVADFSTLR